jgi:prepilin-type N-terminal cleavage/methylation domain-containing protein
MPITRKLSGFTLVEIMVATAIIGIIALGSVTSLRQYFSMTNRTSENMDIEVSRRALHINLNGITKRAIRNSIYMGETLAGYMGLGAQIKWNGLSASVNGSFLVTPQCVLGAGTVCAAPQGLFDVLAIIAIDEIAPIFTIQTAVSFNSTQSVLNGTNTLTLNADPTGAFSPGDVVGISSPSGIEFLQVQSLSPGPPPTFTGVVLYDNGLPVTQLPAGTSVVKVHVYYLESNAAGNSLVLIEALPGGGTSIKTNMPMLGLLSMQIESINNSSKPSAQGSWTDVGQISFQPQTAQFQLRIYRNRTALTAGRPTDFTMTDCLLDLSL